MAPKLRRTFATDNAAAMDPAEVAWQRSLLAAGCCVDFEASELCAVLVQNWTILFETTTTPMPTAPTGHHMTAMTVPSTHHHHRPLPTSARPSTAARRSFSDLTESYLLVRQSAGHQRAVANAFVRISVEQPLIGADEMLSLLLDYLATRVGRAGYQTAQLVLTAVLEAFGWRVHLREREAEERLRRRAAGRERKQENSGGGPKREQNAQRNVLDVEADLATSRQSDDGELKAAGGRNEHDEDANDNAFDEDDVNDDAADDNDDEQPNAYGMQGAAVFADSTVHSEAIKMLVRIYLGQLKRFEIQTTVEATQPGAVSTGHNKALANLMGRTVSLQYPSTDRHTIFLGWTKKRVISKFPPIFFVHNYSSRSCVRISTKFTPITSPWPAFRPIRCAGPTATTSTWPTTGPITSNTIVYATRLVPSAFRNSFRHT